MVKIVVSQLFSNIYHFLYPEIIVTASISFKVTCYGWTQIKKFENVVKLDLKWLDLDLLIPVYNVGNSMGHSNCKRGLIIKA